MKALLPQFSAGSWLGWALMAGATAALAATDQRNPETPMLSQSEYRMSLDDVVVFGQQPYWRTEAPSRWEREPVEIPAEQPTFRWAPTYTREERDEGPPNQLNPQPRIKLFEMKF